MLFNGQYYYLGHIVISGVVGYKKLWAQEAGSCNFPTNSSNFRQRILWVLTILNLPLNSPKVGDLHPQVLYFLEENFPTD